MSSEDKTLEPSDQGPSPAPASSTAATPAGSPAITDKRPRGRPRKDGVAPIYKSKKKSRSRGKASVDDEDSMDGVETAETESAVETETKEQPLENEGIPAAEEKPWSPVLSRSVSEESAGAPAGAATQTKSSEQLCAFCNCGERSLLGQGELKQFSPSPGYTMPRRSQCRTKRDSTGSNEGEGNSRPKLNSTARRQRGQKKDSSPRSAIVSVVTANTPYPCDEPASKFWDELSQVGLPEDTDLQSLSDPSGHCWAHQCCAAWSEGVCREQEQVLVNVDKAVDSGSTTHCAYCKRLGATIKCCEEKCSRLYHYPCAAAAGTFQDIRSHTLLCPEHIEQATGRSKDEANCALCDSPGDLLDQLFCTSCGQHYHGMCLDIGVTPLKRAGWQCPDCKVCQTCKNPGEDSKMLVCDTCDKGYHTFCLQPVMDSIPTNSWRCKNCRVCEQCGTRTSSQWHHNCLLCDNCYQQQDVGLSCPLCGKAFHPDSQKDMLCCQMCKRWIHVDCDRQAENETSVLLKDGYVCTICKQVEVEELQASQTCEVLETTEPVEEPEPACLEWKAVEEPGSLDHAAEENRLNEEQKPVETAAEPAQEVTTMAPKVSEPPPPPPLVPETEPQPPVQISEPEKAAKQEALEEVETAATAALTEAQLERELQPQNSEVPAEVVPLAPEEAGTETEAGEVEPMEVSAPEPTQTQERQETVVQEKKPLETPALAQERLVLELIENHEVAQISDSSLLVEMDSTPASEPSFSDMNSSSEDPTAPTQQSPERSFSVSMDTSKLAEPPVSVGTPPKDVPQVQAATASSGGVPSTTFIPVAPKIGMGKPAITKRTFSPGRPRVRQGAWSTRNMSSSPSWSPDRSEGWDPSKTRQLSSTPIWTVKVEGQLHDEIAHHMQNRRSSYMTRYLVTCSEKQGRGSGFPGRRRPRGAGVPGRGGRGRSKLKNSIGTVNPPGAMVADTTSVKDEEENSMHNTVVLFSSSDRFTMKQDMCVVCGSFGRGPEGRLLACAQCGQCYHPYCVSVKITKVVLSKGWRCLECTVCEACGKATDPGRLLLCDDCDISYHTYCLDPPLQTVPKGGWKCKWCVSCTHCGATSPGLRCEWQNNYTQCAPCGSLATCPVCSQNYKEDELIVQCRQCDRWIHASCQNLNSEEELENAADNSFDCAMCRIYMTPSHGSVPEDPESPVLAHIVTKIKEQDLPKTYTQDGVCLTELGLSRLQSLTVAAPRRKRPKPKLKLKIINQNSVAVLQTPPDPQSELSRDGDMDESREGDLLDCDGKSDSSPEREAADDDSKGAEGADGIKKRKRKPYRPGIGGFMVRQRSRTGQGKAKRSLCRKDSSGSVSECLLGKEESWNEPLPDTPVEETAPASECIEKAKKRYRKKKNKLEEVFPAYLQEAFFGRNLLDTSRQSRLSLDFLSDEDPARIDGRTPSVNTNFLDPSSDPLLSSTSTPISAKPAALSNPEDPLAALSEVLNTDDDILGILSDELVKPGENSAGLDVGPVSDDSSLAPLASTGRSTRPPPEEPLGGVLSPELDTMVTDGAILSKLYKIPELEGKDVEELFTAVLSPSANQTPQHSHIPLQNQGDGLFPRMPIMNGLMGPTPHFPSPQIPPGAGPCIPSTFSPIHRSPFSDSCRDKKPQFNELVGEAAGSWAAPGPVVEAEADTMSNAQRSTLKWEKEETLGEMATVAPVLYTNMNFPSLKEEFPEWSTRVKQIAKLWRKASSQERAPYVQKARDNRAALRINKVQMSNDTIKRQQHHQEIIDPNIPIESDLLFKDPLKPKESEHEQEWKFRQQLRQKNKQQAKIEATQKLEQVKSEQQQQLQQQQSSGQSGSDSPNSGNQSPLTPQPSNGNMSPAQETMPKDGFATPQPPGTPTASSSNDVFLRPQAPPPTPTRIPVQDPFSQAQPAQPQSPQMFSPGSSNSRPSSPWDPYAKMVGTPRPPAMGPNPPRRKSIDPCTPPSAGTRLGAEQQERNRPSPAHESFVSPSSINNDPYSKPPDTPRPVLSADLFAKPMGPPRTVASAEQSGKLPLGSTAGGDTFARPGLRAEVYQRMQMSHSRMILSDPYTRPLLTPIPGSNESGAVSLFKAPMPPSQSLQDPYPAMSSTLRRMSTEPYQRPVLTPRPADGFSQNQMNDPFAQPPLTPCPVMNDTFSHPPRMSRQSQRDPFSQPGPIARPQSQDLYAQAPLTPGPAPLQSADPYSQPPSTPRPRMGERFAQSPIHQRNSDQYAQPPGTQRPVMNDPYSQPPGTPRPVMNDPYSQPPGTPRPVMNDPYSQPPGTPRPGASETFNRPVVTRPGLMPNQDPFSPAHQNRAAGTQETFVRPSDPCSQTSKLSGMTEEPFAQPNQLNQTSIHDLYEQPPMTPLSQSGGVFDDGCLARDITEQHGTGKEGNFGVSSTLNMPGLVAAGVTSEAQNNMHISQGDTEEKLRQRLRLREIILRQQQQKIAVRQEKVLQDPALSAAPGTPRHWSQEDPNRPNEPFNRPPPPYPGTLRGPLIAPGAQRFPGPFPNDPRGSFPRDRLFNRPPCTGDVTGMGMRPRFGFPPSGQGPIPSQERFLGPPHQMQGSMSGFPQQLRRSLSVDLPRPMGSSYMNNPIGLHQHFPPRGMQMQQHNIMGQPFIELRHRAPESRLRLQFGPSLMAQENVMDPSSQRTGGFISGQEMGFSGNQGSRLMEPMINQHPGMISHMQMSTSFEHIPMNQMQMHTGHPHAALMRSLSHPVTSETFSVAPLDYFPSTSAESTEEIPLASQDVIAEKLDPDDSAVKDLDDVEVKDLDDEDLENLNLDPEDGKGDDLDLETNDLHLDDFLRSGKFDIIAYTDPELDLGDKKDMFNEELDLSDPIEDHPEAVEEQKTESKDVNTNSADVSPKKEATSGMKFKLEKTPERLQDVKQESSNSNENTDPSSSEHTLKTEAHAHAHPPTDKDQSEERNTRSQENTGGSPSLSEVSAPSSTGTLAGSTPALPSLLIKDKVDNAELGPLGPPTQSMSPAHQNHVTGMPQNPNVLMTPGQMQEHAANPNLSMDEIMDHTFSQGAPPPVNPNFIQGQDFSTEQQIGTHIPMVNQSEPNGMSATEQALISQALSQQNRERPLLLDEQPLLLQDLLDQERQEQQQQRQMQAMIRQRSSDSFFPNIDFDAITDPIMKAKMVALKGINKVMVQNSMGMPSMVMNRFQFVGQQMPEPEVGEGVSVPQQAIEPDGKLAPQMARPNPPSFDPGFVNDAQKKQYEEWLQDTQQLLQMQQKFLEEQIGVHRKSKKALSAKQRTAKKAGREFPEDDAEQLKHVTEQQSVVQKQLEQIRKQQKEHAELIEEYRIKQQQQGTGSPALIQGVQSQAPVVPGSPPPVMTQQNFPILPQQMEQHLAPIPGQPTPPRMPGVPGWHPGAPAPMAGLRMQSQLPSHIPVNPAPPEQAPLPGENAPQAVAAAEASTAGNGAHVKFDDNNPFSEGFQERERKERLREQQERQRIQLMQEVERQRALQQRLELEQQQQQQQGIVGPEMSRASLSQMPYFNSELPHDFMQRLQQQQQQLPTQQQMGQMFPQQQSMQQGFISPSPGTPFAQGNERRHIMGNGPFGPPDMPVGGPNFQPSNQGIQGANFVQGQPRPPAFMPAMSHGTGEGPPFGMEPVASLPPSYPGSGQSLIQLYSNIIPEEKGKKKRNRKKKKKEDNADSVKAPSTPHSDLTTPLTPSVSDTASTPTRIMASDSLTYNKGEPETAEFLAGSSTPRSGVSQPPTELERQLSASSSNGNTTHQQAVGRQSSIGSETDQQEEPAKLLHEIKLEQMEATECRGPRESKVEVSEIVKLEGKEGTPPYPADHSPAHGASGTGGKLESGNELLKHLLKNKNTPSLLPQQRSEEEEEEGAAQSTLLQKQNYTEGAVPTADNKMQGNLNQEVPRLQHADREQDKKKQRYKRAPKSGEKPAPRPKKRKKDEDDRHVPYPKTDSLMSQLKQQLSLLPLMEPLVGVNFAHFPPYGSGRNGENRLTGTFGSASLDGVSDYYSQLIYKQNNLSNPPTPPASLPPTPPPVARQKMVNGFATAEELASKAGVMRGPDVTKGLGPRQFQMPFRPEEDLLARAMAHGPKTVDVPASLPTPPHNNQEELRGQDHCDERDSPDSFVPSSSPESVLGMEVRRYPDLSLVKQEPPDPAPSPVIPILPSCSGKGSEFRRCDVKMEPPGVFFGPEFGQPANCSQAGLVSIAITLNPAAAGNINGVVAAVADLLRVKLPNSYEASAAPDRPPAALLNSMKMQHHHRFEHRPPPLFSGAGSGQPAIMRFMRPSGPSGMFQPQVRFTPINSGSIVGKRDEQFVKGNPGSKPQWCCHCKVVVLGNGVCKSAKDLPFNKQDLHEGPGRSEGNMVFCSHNCFVLYSTGMQAKATETQEATSAQLDSTPSKTFHQYSNNTSTLDVHCLPQLQPKESPAPTPPITFPQASSEMMKLESKPDELKVTVKLKSRPRAVQASVDESRPLSKRWKGMRWRKWSVQIVIPKGNLKLPCEGEITELLKRLGTSLRPEPLPKDHRKCCFCHEEGDGITDGPARLLNLDLDLWVHLNCALWSSEVYETQAGALINVELALRRGLSMKCLYCQKMGATSGCQRLRCTNIYHFTCALRAQCMFFKDKTMLCHMHRPRGGAPEHELRYFAVFRRVYVQRDEVKQIASIVQRGERDHTFRVGSLIFHAIGQLLPQQMKAFHTATAIFPVGYEASRLYWSMRYSNRRCQYMCSIDERDSQPEFIIRVVEQGHEDLVLTDTTPKGVWDKVLEPVAERRNESGTLKLFQAYLKGEDLFGLTVSAVVRIAESLPGVEACGSYIFRYGRNPLMELPLSINPTGSARSQPKTSSHVKRFVLRPHTLNSTSTSKSFQSTVTGELNAPYSKQFVHSKSSQYRKMKTEWKGNVYLARSRIQGLGLYAARDIEKHTMVIEYMGTVIRNEVANRKEKHYESQNRGVFIFRMDSEHVIDATLTGGPARYINHSCAPNCVAEVVTFEKGHKIIISSNQRIHRGQELCYDYKFDFEDDQHKIPCHCGAVNCRKWMN